MLKTEKMAEKLAEAVMYLRETKGSFISSRGPNAPLTLADMGITNEKLELIDRVAWDMAYGATASYIPALIDPSKVDPTKRCLVVMDLFGNVLTSGNGDPRVIRPSYQSTIKHHNATHCMGLGELPEVIAGILQTNRDFNNDRVLDPSLNVQRADNLVNNAGTISASKPLGPGFYEEKGFLEFMRKLTGNPRLKVDDDIFESERATGFNNFAIAYRLGAAGRFGTHEEVTEAVERYFRGCSIVATPVEMGRSNLVLAAGGMDLDARLRAWKDDQPFFNPDYCIIKPDAVVRAENALNVAGMYRYQPVVNLHVSGVRATTMKSGVSGVEVAIQPGAGVAVTYHVWLDGAGNSTYGNIAHILLNEAMSAPSVVPIRLSPEELERSVHLQEREDTLATVKNVLGLVTAGHADNTYRLKPEMVRCARGQHLKQLALLKNF